jgi:hypothetical protein
MRLRLLAAVKTYRCQSERLIRTDEATERRLVQMHKMRPRKRQSARSHGDLMAPKARCGFNNSARHGAVPLVRWINVRAHARWQDLAAVCSSG